MKIEKYTQTLMRIIALVLLSFNFQHCYGPKKAYSQEAIDETSLVFDPEIGGYSTTRIPALVMTKNQILLAFCEARVNSSSDWADIDLLMKRSKDGGITWEPTVIIAPREPGKPTSNITPIIDDNGTIHLLYHRNYSTAYYIKSNDDGESWSEPEDISYVFEAFRPEYNWKVMAPGPGHAIQLQNGRLLVPVWLCEPDPNIPGGDHRPSSIATIFSDDLGKTWERGDIVSNTTPEIIHPSEHVAVELADGRVMLNIRSESKPHLRLISYSHDGATNWSKPEFDDELFDPVCMASLIRVSGGVKEKNSKSRLLFVNPDSQNDLTVTNKTNFRLRQNLTAKLSYDEGKTWEVQKILDPGKAGYSDLAVGKDGMLYCLSLVSD